MLKLFHFLLCYRFKEKHSTATKKKSKNSGFTLIELLVAMVLAFLVITPLLGFMINILDTDRREQAKIKSEQEVQAALDYIAQDLKQAIYIYDSKGVEAIKSQLPDNNLTDRLPVLVFWKRRFLEDSIGFAASKTSRKDNDAYVYSLVAYYLIQDNATNDSRNIWSDQFRIARFEVKDGIRDLDNPIKPNGDPNYVRDRSGKEQAPDAGFKLFKLNDTSITGTLEDKMNAWKKDTASYTNNTDVLIDYVDKSDKSKDKSLEPIDCTTVFPLTKVPNEKKAEKTKALRIPASDNTSALNNGSFYACVDIDQVSAKVFIRGNALARIQNTNNTFDKGDSSYFPNISVQVKGRGLIGGE